jgi:bifunctional ADP-heptose synthase (sugar kinase/adenylyltransferase)
MSNLLVIGDLIIDETWPVEITRLNPEVPAPTAEILSHIPTKTPGGAGFAAAWAARQGMKVILLTASSPQNNEILSTYGVEVFSPWEIQNGHNIKKIRYIERNSGYHLLRLDNDRLVPPPGTDPESVIKALSLILAKCSRIDACLLSDYAKGFFHGTVHWNPVLKWLEEKGIPTLLDTRAKDLQSWVGEHLHHTWVKLNDRELATIAKSQGIKEPNPYRLIGHTKIWKLIVTHGPAGANAYIFLPPDGVKTYDASPSSKPGTVVDPTGCGDILDTSFISSIGDGKSTQEALEYAVKTATEFAFIRLKDKLNERPNPRRET